MELTASTAVICGDLGDASVANAGTMPSAIPQFASAIESSFCFCKHHRAGPVAQWLEQSTHNALVLGSSPGGPTNPIRLAALSNIHTHSHNWTTLCRESLLIGKQQRGKLGEVFAPDGPTVVAIGDVQFVIDAVLGA